VAHGRFVVDPVEGFGGHLGHVHLHLDDLSIFDSHCFVNTPQAEFVSFDETK
jgi:hypothetical protein